MKNLSKFGVQELDAVELVYIDGGRRIPWSKLRELGKKAWKYLEKTAVVIQVGEAIDEFKKGWDSVDCGC